MKKQILSLALVFTAVAVIFSACKKDDTGAPTVSIVGDGTYTIDLGATWADPGSTANDEQDGNITSDIVVTGTVNVDQVGEYTITYKVTDKAGNESSATRTVKVQANKLAKSYSVTETYSDGGAAYTYIQVVGTASSYNALTFNGFGDYQNANPVVTVSGTTFTAANFNFGSGTEATAITNVSGTFTKSGINYNIATATYKQSINGGTVLTVTQAYTVQ